MTQAQEEAIRLIQRLPDDKIRAIITLAAADTQTPGVEKGEAKRSSIARRKLAFERLNRLKLDVPPGFDPDAERYAALVDKYGPVD